MKYLSLSVAAAALLLAPTTAHAQLFGGFDNSTVLGGLAGAGIGGAIGSNLAGSGNRDEGTAIGAALGGLAGAAYGNSRSNYYGNPYAGSFNPGFTGNSLLGTAVGAGIGGAIGSNLAGSGVRQEGTAIGAVLGGLAGNALTSGSRYGNRNFNGGGFNGGGFAPAGFNGGGFSGPSFNPAFNTGFVPQNYGPAFAPAPQFSAPSFAQPSFGGGVSFVPGGYVDAGTFASTTTVMPAPTARFIPAQAPVFQPQVSSFSNVSYTAPSYNRSTRYGDSVGSTVTQNYVGSTGVSAPLTLRRAPQSQVIVMEREHYSPPVSSAPSRTHHPHTYVTPSHAAPMAAGPSITADTVNINYGNNSQVGTHGSYNGSTLGGGYGHSGYSAPTAPIDFGDGIGDGTWGELGGEVHTGSHSVGSTTVLGGYEGGYSFPLQQGVTEFVSNCATSTFGCASSQANWNQAPHQDHTLSNTADSGLYRFCGSSKVYNDEGALLVGASPVCR